MKPIEKSTLESLSTFATSNNNGLDREQQSALADVIDAGQKGLYDGLSGIAEFVGAKDTRDWAVEKSNEQIESMSDAGREAMSQQFFREDSYGNIQAGQALMNPRAIAMQAAHMLGLNADILIGGTAVRGGRFAVTKVANLVKNKLKNKIKDPDLLAEAAREGTRTYMNKLRDTAGSMIDYGTATHAVTSGLEGISLRDEVNAMEYDELAKSPLFQQTVRRLATENPDVNGVEILNAARSRLADEAANQVKINPTLLASNYLVGGLGGLTLEKLLRGKAGKLTSMGVETATEGVQGSAEQFASNQVAKDTADPDRDLSEGVLVSGLNEAVAGGVAAGVPAAGRAAYDRFTQSTEVTDVPTDPAPTAEPVRTPPQTRKTPPTTPVQPNLNNYEVDPDTGEVRHLDQPRTTAPRPSRPELKTKAYDVGFTQLQNDTWNAFNEAMDAARERGRYVNPAAADKVRDLFNRNANIDLINQAINETFTDPQRAAIDRWNAENAPAEVAPVQASTPNQSNTTAPDNRHNLWHERNQYALEQEQIQAQRDDNYTKAQRQRDIQEQAGQRPLAQLSEAEARATAPASPRFPTVKEIAAEVKRKRKKFKKKLQIQRQLQPTTEQKLRQVVATYSKPFKDMPGYTPNQVFADAIMNTRTMQKAIADAPNPEQERENVQAALMDMADDAQQSLQGPEEQPRTPVKKPDNAGQNLSTETGDNSVDNVPEDITTALHRNAVEGMDKDDMHPAHGLAVDDDAVSWDDLDVGGMLDRIANQYGQNDVPDISRPAAKNTLMDALNQLPWSADSRVQEKVNQYKQRLSEMDMADPQSGNRLKATANNLRNLWQHSENSKQPEPQPESDSGVKTAYHGSLRKNDSVHPQSSPDSIFGDGLYLTSAREDAENYASTDPVVNRDLGPKAERYAERNYGSRVGDDYVRAKAELTKDGGRIFEVDYKLQNPLVIDDMGFSVGNPRAYRRALAESDITDTKEQDRILRQLEKAYGDPEKQFEVLQRHNALKSIRQYASIQNHDGVEFNEAFSPVPSRQRNTGITHTLILDDSAIQQQRVEETPEAGAMAKAEFDAQFSNIDRQANEAATSPTNDLPEPTDAQKEAGNYKKGHTKVAGFDISIENPKGSVRSGTDANGETWHSTMNHHYGDIKGTTGADNDPVDVFIGPNPASEKVYVVDQNHPGTTQFDEHKVMLGFDSLAEAQQAYLDNYEPGWDGLRDITETTPETLKTWLDSKATRKPFLQSTGEQTHENQTTGAGNRLDPNHDGNGGRKSPDKTGPRIDDSRESGPAGRESATASTDNGSQSSPEPKRDNRGAESTDTGRNQSSERVTTTGDTRTDSVSELRIEPNTEKSFLVTGDVEKHKSALLSMHGSRNKRGFVFSNKRREQVETFIASLPQPTRKGTAPEHAHNQGKPLDESTRYEPVATGASAQTAPYLNSDDVVPLSMSVDDFNEVTDEWAALFEHPQEKVITANRVGADYLTPKEAKAEIDSWKKHVKTQFIKGRGENSKYTILSLFDYTGEWSKPYEEAGYNVLRFDIQNDAEYGDIMKFSAEFFNENFDIQEVYGILAATPCTDFAVSGARWFKDKDADGRTEASKELVFQTLRTIEYFRPKFWVLENPVGRIERLTGLPKARMTFDPHHFGAPYTKKTVLWGKFNADLPTANVDPVDGSKMHRMYGGKSQATKNARSETPEGFAYAFFMANNRLDQTAEQRLLDDYPDISGAVKQALKAGLTEDEIREAAIEYENYDPEQAAKDLAKAIAIHQTPTVSSDNVKSEKKQKMELAQFLEEQGNKLAWPSSVWDKYHELTDFYSPKDKFDLTEKIANGDASINLQGLKEAINKLTSDVVIKHEPTTKVDDTPVATKEDKVKQVKMLSTLLKRAGMRNTKKNRDAITAALQSPDLPDREVYALYWATIEAMPRHADSQTRQAYIDATARLIGDKFSNMTRHLSREASYYIDEPIDNYPSSDKVGWQSFIDRIPQIVENTTTTPSQESARAENRQNNAGRNSDSAEVSGNESVTTASRSQSHGASSENRAESPDSDGAGSLNRAERGNQNDTTERQFRLDDIGDIANGTASQRVAGNLAAIRLSKQLQREKRPATEAEKAVLARYVGWGGLKTVFDNVGTRSKFEREADTELQFLLTKNEYNAVRNSVRTAFYTSKPVVKAMWAGVKAFNVNGKSGKINALEPSVGSGNFIGWQPASMRDKTRWSATELDPVTGTIAQQIYDDANVRVSGFEDAPFKTGVFSLAIGNPPFGSQPLHDSRFPDISGLSLHNFMIAKSAKLLHENGLVMQVITSRFLDTKNPNHRDLSKSLEFIGAVRLPNTAFKSNAGTEVTTDIVVFRKLRKGETATNTVWTDTDGQVNGIKVNKYFEQNPQHILGRLASDGTMYGDRSGTEITVHPTDEHADLEKSITKALTNMAKGVDLTLTPETQDAISGEVMLSESDLPIGGFMVDKDGKVKYRKDDGATGAQVVEITPQSVMSENGQWLERIQALLNDNAPMSQLRAFGRDNLFNTKGKPDSALKSKAFTAFFDYTGLSDKPNPGVSEAELRQLVNEGVDRARLNEKNYQKLKRILTIRNTALALVKAEKTDADNIEALRAQLNEQYDTFSADFGTKAKPAAISQHLSVLGDDLSLESALDTVNPDGVITKHAIFTKRVMESYKAPRTANNLDDAVTYSIRSRGRVDVDYVAGLLGISKLEAKAKLTDGESPYLLLNPETEKYEFIDDYLSGNVKQKYKQAQDAGLTVNAKLLKGVLPADKPADKVKASIRATWLDKDIFERFLADLGYDADVNVSTALGRITIESERRSEKTELGAQFTHNRVSVPQLFEAATAGKSITISDKLSDGSFRKNEAETKTANVLVNKLAELFKTWIATSDDTRQQVARNFNDRVNTHIERKYNGRLYLRPVGINPLIPLRKTQLDGALRGIQSSNTLLDHTVGAGKTFTQITTIMERKRLGLSNKPLLAVPNHIIGSFAADFYTLYPGANILVASEKQMSAKHRRKFFSKIATGDYDAIIIGHSHLKNLPNSPQSEETVINEKVDELRIALEEAKRERKDAGGRGASVSQIEDAIDRLNRRLKDMKEQASKNDDNIGLTFDEMGIDYLAIDEAHEFKNLMYSTSSDRVVGMNDPKGSQKAFDLLVKVRSVQRREDGAGAVSFMTGTPISNSLVELYTMMYYLGHNDLKSNHISHYDAFAGSFLNTETNLEYTATGTLKERVVLKGLNNVKELNVKYRQFADVVGRDDMVRIFAEDTAAKNKEDGGKRSTKFPIPKVKGGQRQIDLAPATEQQILFNDALIARMERINSIKSRDERAEYARIDNPLWVLSDARKASLDIRLVDPGASRDKTGKVSRASKNIKRIYDAWDSDKGTQLVFSDMGVPVRFALANAKKALRALADEIMPNGKQYVDSRLKTIDEGEGPYSLIASELADRLTIAVERNEIDTDAEDKLREQMQKDSGLFLTADANFSVYDDLKAALIEQGIPEKEIEFIHDHDTQVKKEKLFNNVRAGRVRVLIGSSAKMGAGTNVQDKLVALHHMDAPWRPAEMEQREGRIIRQGNKLYQRDPDGFEVEVLAYATSGSSDPVMWQILERKAASIEQFRRGEIDEFIEESESDADSFAELKAQTTGNPVYREKLIADSRLLDVETETKSAQIEYGQAERFVRNYEKEVARAESTLAAIDKVNMEALSPETLADLISQQRNSHIAAIDRFEQELEVYNSLDKAEQKKTKKPQAPKRPSLLDIQHPYIQALKSNIVDKVDATIKLKVNSDKSFSWDLGGARLTFIVSPSTTEGAYYVDGELRVGDAVSWLSGDGAVKSLSGSQKRLAELMPQAIQNRIDDLANTAKQAKQSQDAGIERARKILKKRPPTEKLEAAAAQVDWLSTEVALADVVEDIRRSKQANRYIDESHRPIRRSSFDPSKLTPETVEINGKTYRTTGFEHTVNPDRIVQPAYDTKTGKSVMVRYDVTRADEGQERREAVDVIMPPSGVKVSDYKALATQLEAEKREAQSTAPDINDELMSLSPMNSKAQTSMSRRRLLKGVSAVAVSMAVPGRAYANRDALPLGKASPIPETDLYTKLDSQLLSEMEKGLPLRDVLKRAEPSAPASLKPLFKVLKPLVGTSDIPVVHDPITRSNTHGVTSMKEGVKITLYSARDSSGDDYNTLLHEALHAVVAKRYAKLSVALPGNYDLLNVPQPKNAEAMRQFRQLWREFGATIEKLPKEEQDRIKQNISMYEAWRSPDEFFVRALTDPDLQQYLAQHEYEGRTLWQRFRDWVVTSLFGFRKTGTRPSWLDAALLGANDLIDGMGQDIADDTFRMALNEELANREAMSPANSRKALTDTSDVLFDETAVEKVQKGSKPLSKQAVELYLKKFFKEFPGLDGTYVNVTASPVDTFGEAQTRRIGAMRSRGSYNPVFRRINLYYSNIHSVGELRRVLLHELHVHQGLGLYSMDAQKAILSEINRTRDSRNPTLRKIWKQVTQLYSHESELVQAEEVLAKLAETEPRQKSGLMGALQKVLRVINEYWRKLNPKAAPSKIELEDMLIGIANALRAGKMPGPRPRRDKDRNFVFEDLMDMGDAEQQEASQNLLSRMANRIKNIAQDVKKRGIWEVVDDIKQQTRPTWLGTIPRRYLADLANGALPSIHAYMRRAKQMDADRNELMQAPAKNTDSLREYASKYPKQYKVLTELFHASTIASIDPSKPFMPLRDTTQFDPNNVMSRQDDLATGELITPEYVKKRTKELKELAKSRSGEGTKKFMDRIQHLKDKLAQQINREKVEPDIRDMWDALNAEGQRLYETIRDSYIDQNKEYQKALEERIMETMLDDQYQKVYLTHLQQMFETLTTEGPYFPLARFGNFYGVVRDHMDNVVEFVRFEKVKEQKAWLAEQRKRWPKKYKIAHGAMTNRYDELTKKVDPKYHKNVMQVLETNNVYGPIRDQIHQMYLQMLPEMSSRKNWIHRKKTPGYHPDALRAYAHNMFHGAHQIGKLKHEHKMSQYLDDMRAEAKVAIDTNRAEHIVDEMAQRHSWAMNPKNGKWAANLTSVGFMWYLGATPAAAAVNLLQTPMLALPILGARYGYGAASAELLKSSKEFAQGRGHIDKVLTDPAEKSAFAEFQRRGLIEKTMAHDLAGVSEGGVEYSSTMHKVMEKVATFFHQAERYNREATVMAAYRLARKAGVADPVEVAEQLTYDAHFDYANAERPRFMQGDVAKVLFLFRQHAINMTYRLLRDYRNAFHGETPEVRSLARKQLTGVLGMTALMSGAAGLPMYSVISGVLNLMLDDEDEPYDFNTEFRVFLADYLGETTAQALVHGVVDTATGASISGRVALNNLWIRDADATAEGRNLVQHYTEQLLGPIFGIAFSAGTSYDIMREGQFLRGLEYGLPKAMKDVLRSFRYATEGANNLRGDALVPDMTTLEMAYQAMGFMPARLTEQYEQNRAIKDAEVRLLRRRAILLGKYALAVRQRDREYMIEVMRDITAFNRINPSLKITAETREQSLKRRAAYTAKSESGINIDERLTHLKRDLAFTNL